MEHVKQNGQVPQNDDLDRILDTALAKYASAEPRAGLEQRVLAQMRTVPVGTPGRVWLQWALAAGLAVLAIGIVVASRSHLVRHPLIANHPPAPVQGPTVQEEKTGPHSTDEAVITKHVSTRKPATRRAHETLAITHPKLDRFPSSQPLTAEEIALAQYVKNFPKDAQLVAKAQEEFALETEKVMHNAGSETRPSTSIQQER